MDEFNEGSLLADDFGVEPWMLAAGAAGVYVVGASKLGLPVRSLWHRIWGKVHHPRARMASMRVAQARPAPPRPAPPRVMPSRAATQQMPYLDELAYIETGAYEGVNQLF
jgi:hypothetical protein